MFSLLVIKLLKLTDQMIGCGACNLGMNISREIKLEGKMMLSANIGKRSVFSIGKLVKLLLVLSVSGDLFRETDVDSNNKTERYAFSTFTNIFISNDNSAVLIFLNFKM